MRNRRRCLETQSHGPWSRGALHLLFLPAQECKRLSSPPAPPPTPVPHYILPSCSSCTSWSSRCKFLESDLSPDLMYSSDLTTSTASKRDHMTVESAADEEAALYINNKAMVSAVSSVGVQEIPRAWLSKRQIDHPKLRELRAPPARAARFKSQVSSRCSTSKDCKTWSP